MKIFIWGNAATGKTELSKKLSDKYNLPLISLDDLYWKEKYITKNKRDIFDISIKESINIKSEKWLIEGALLGKEIDQILNNAEKIIYIEEKNALKLIRRIIQRKCERKSNHLNNGESVIEILKLIIWVIKNIALGSYQKKLINRLNVIYTEDARRDYFVICNKLEKRRNDTINY